MITEKIKMTPLEAVEAQFKSCESRTENTKSNLEGLHIQKGIVEKAITICETKLTELAQAKESLQLVYNSIRDAMPKEEEGK